MVHLGTVGQQQLNNLLVPILAAREEGSAAVVRGLVHSNAVGQQQLHHVLVSGHAARKEGSEAYVGGTWFKLEPPFIMRIPTTSKCPPARATVRQVCPSSPASSSSTSPSKTSSSMKDESPERLPFFASCREQAENLGDEA